jgi:hypothetical protein
MGSPFERRVRDDIVKSLGEWGVRRSESDEHAKLYGQAIQAAITDSRPTEQKNAELFERMKDFRTKPNAMPRNPVDAIIHVLAKELEGVDECRIFYDVEDKLDLPFQPFYLWTNKANKVVFKRRLGFEKFKLEQLDPLNLLYQNDVQGTRVFFLQVEQ